jgi:acyl-CoA synthetase (AMP-forming)/AMP-acid ligase II
METGGFKGRSRAVSRDDLYDELNRRLGVPLRHIVNEYGMTELLSQFYEPVIRGGAPEAPSERFHLPPPWVRTRIVDPMTLEAVPEGEVGLLSHLDLANVGSVVAVLTEDLGQKVASGFRLIGRARDAEPRGCSLAMEELMAVVGRKK